MRNLPSLWRSGPAFETNSFFPEINRLQRQVDRLFNEFLVQPFSTNEEKSLLSESIFEPSCEIQEIENHYVMSFDLPGVRKEDIRVDLDDDILTVSGERKEEREEKGKSRYRSERFYGSFERSLRLPSAIKADQVETSYADGVLRIAVPKMEESKAQTIKIGEGKSGFWNKFLSHKKEDQQKISVQESKTEKAA